MSRQPQPWDVSDCGPSDIARAAEKEHRRARVEIRDRGLPTVSLTAPLPEIIAEAIEALVRRRVVFQRGTVLVEVVRQLGEGDTIRRAAGTPVVAPIRAGRVRELLADVVEFQRGDRVVHPPQWLGTDIVERGHWSGIPELRGVVCNPIMRPDGTILARPGYDASTGILAEFDASAFPDVPLHPSDGEVAESVSLLREPYRDFPFASDVDAAVAVAAVITAVGRVAVDGPVPATHYNAAVPGAGKTLAASVGGLIATGSLPAVITADDRPEEFRKVITAIALAGDRYVLVDNIPAGRFGNPQLAAALTAREWRDRLLGGNRMATLPLAASWALTGNNVVFRGDLGRRILVAQLAPGVERPEERSGFAHEDLLAYVAEHRSELLVAALVVLRHHAAKGFPRHTADRLGSFERWDDVVRQAVIGAGLPDPCRGRANTGDGADADLDLLRQTLHLWRDRFGPVGGVTVAQALRRCQPETDAMGRPVPGTGDDELAAVLTALDPRGGSRPSARAVGNALAAMRGRIADGLVLEKEPAGGGIFRWRVADTREGGGGAGGGLGWTNPQAVGNREKLAGWETVPPNPRTPDRNGHPHPADGEPDPERQAIEQEGQP
ncbi:MAG: hypothetical protein IT458_19735 [Planctomycetes bacterium]|nr:hypothetical protein [Planctomycetota bacterium]